MTIDQQHLDQFLAGFVGDQAAATHMATVVLGEQLGLYRALAESGPHLACGFGTTAVLLAEGFAAATVAGFDSHSVSIDSARRAAADAGVADRVTFEVADAADLPGDGYDLVCSFNALHEMGDPVRVCHRVRDALADGGVLMLVEPNAGDTDDDNFRHCRRVAETPLHRVLEVTS